MKHMFKLIAGFLAISMFLVSCTSNKQADVTATEEYVIGIVAPLTGPGINLSLPYLRGLELAIDEINQQGGVANRTIRVVAQDGRLEAAESASATQFLLAKEDPDIVSVVFAIPAVGAGPILESAGKTWVYEAYPRGPLKFSNSFKGNFDSKAGCEQLIRFAQEQGRYKKLGLLMSQTPYNEECAEGIQLVEDDLEEYWYQFGKRDFRDLLTRAHHDGVDALMTIGIDFEYITMFQQLSELQYDIKMICATAVECIYPDVEEKASSDVLEGTLSIDFVAPDFNESAFAQLYRSHHSDASALQVVYGAVGYEAGQYLSNALGQCEPGDDTCFYQALEQSKDYYSVLNTNGFEDRMLTLPLHLYEYHNGKWQEIEK